MADTNHKPNLLKRKVQGAVQPKQSFQETAEEQRVSTKSTKVSKNKTDNQKKSIKISAETYKDLLVVKQMDSLSFDYEVIQMLLDQYTKNFSESDARRFTVLRENL
ncbi:hypothetical protein [Lacticaseibacillus suibinensis]|uniref:hypothetical protein n=1 Tax=Lacticaseibacillus suibinensis TaxID=2486011 RepID=UPI000F789439|nr:hypothetical protein [Lacticaseibacillus suibinensis]